MEVEEDDLTFMQIELLSSFLPVASHYGIVCELGHLHPNAERPAIEVKDGTHNLWSWQMTLQVLLTEFSSEDLLFTNS